MMSEKEIWQKWAFILDSWGMREPFTWILEAAGPVLLIGAQLVYLTEPFLGIFISKDHLREFGNVLETNDRTQAFCAFLREDT